MPLKCPPAILRSSLLLLGFVLPILVSCASEPSRAERLKLRQTLDALYVQEMAAWPVPFEDRFFPTRYGLAHAVVSGPREAPALLLFHAMGLNAASWSANIASLAAGYRVFVFDNLGDQGYSLVRFDGPENRADVADWVAELIPYCSPGNKPVFLGGCSQGGWIAHAAAIAHPDLVSGLILISPAAGIPERTTWMKFLSAILADSSPAGIRKVGSSLLGTGPSAAWLDWFTASGQSYQATRLVMPDTFSDAEVRKTGCPTLLLIGDREVVYENPAEVFARARRLIPRLTEAAIPSAGHLGHIDNPAFCNEKILAFLGEAE